MGIIHFKIKVIIILVLRSLQLLWTIICLGLAAGYISIIDGNYDRITYTLVISVLTLIYLVPLFISFFLQVLVPLSILLLEVIFFILWLAAFGAITDVFGNADCSFAGYDGFGYYYIAADMNKACKIGKALIAFTLFNWITFAITLCLLICFSIIPLYKVGGFKSLLVSDNFEVGGIETKTAVSAANDPESNAGEAEPKQAESDEPQIKDETEDPPVTADDTPDPTVEPTDVPATEYNK